MREVRKCSVEAVPEDICRTDAVISWGQAGPVVDDGADFLGVVDPEPDRV